MMFAPATHFQIPWVNTEVQHSVFNVNASRGLLCNCETSSSTRYSHSAGVKLCPGGDELSQVVGAEDGGVPGEVVEVVHDDGHEEVEHEEAAEEDKGDEEEVGDVAAAELAGLQQLPGGLVPLDGARVADLPRPARKHDVGPRLPGGAPDNSNISSNCPATMHCIILED